jgi:seryl-tRNA synthetase
MDEERRLAKIGLDEAVASVKRVEQLIETAQASLAATKPGDQQRKETLNKRITRLTKDLAESQAAAKRAQVSFNALQLSPENYVRAQEDTPAGRAAASAVTAAFAKPRQGGRGRKTRHRRRKAGRRRRRTYREPKGLFAF